MKRIKVRPYPSPFKENPYLTLLYTHLDPDIEVVYDRPISMLYFATHPRQVDIVHLHWIQYYYTGGDFLEGVKKFFDFLATIVIAKLKGCKIVWTLHNLMPHEMYHETYEYLIRFCY